MQYINVLNKTDGDEISVTSEEAFRNLVRLTQFPEEDVQREAVWSLAILASNSCMLLLFLLYSLFLLFELLLCAKFPYELVRVYICSVHP